MPGAAVAPGWPSLHLVVSLEALAHKRLPVVALEGLGARVSVALLHLLLLGHGHGLTLALEAGGHECLALVALLVPSLGVARLHALLLRVGVLLVGCRGYRRAFLLREGTEAVYRCCGDGWTLLGSASPPVAASVTLSYALLHVFATRMA